MADAPKAPPARAPQGGFADLLGLGLLALGGWVIARHVLTPNFAKVAALLGKPWTPAIVQSAWRWSQKRGLPFAWVLSTIIVESGGNTNSSGDAGGESKGLMQVNTVANAKEIAQAKYTPTDLYKPDVGIEMGTLIYRKIYDHLLGVIGGRQLQTPIDVTTRLAYKGPTTVEAAIKRGEEPANISWAPAAIAEWRSAAARVAAATGTGAPKLPFV